MLTCTLTLSVATNVRALAARSILAAARTAGHAVVGRTRLPKTLPVVPAQRAHDLESHLRLRLAVPGAPPWSVSLSYVRRATRWSAAADPRHSRNAAA